MNNISGTATNPNIKEISELSEKKKKLPKLNLKKEIQDLLKVKESLEKKYVDYPKKEIYDTITHVDDCIRSLQ